MRRCKSKTMKNTIILFALILFGCTMGAQAQETYDKFEVQVDGLGCPFCAYGLEKKFKEFKGIREVKIDIATGQFTFDYPAEKALSLKDVENQVHKAGYTPIAAHVTRADGRMEAKQEKPNRSPDATQTTEASLKVAGNCEMCQARIEKAAMQLEWVYDASWNKETKILDLTYDPAVGSAEAVEKAIAHAGHDTENHKAQKEVYNNLPPCCQYERIQSSKK